MIDLLETSYTDVSIVPEDLGGRRFYIMNNEDLSLIVAETYVNGLCIDISYHTLEFDPLSESDIDELMLLIEDMAIE